MAQQRTGRLDLVLRALQEQRGQLTESEAAQLVGVSLSWFRHDFRRYAAMSFRTARLQAKLAHGADLLTTTTLSIGDISAILGYSDRTKFEKAFKKSKGVTPSTYRHPSRLSPSHIDFEQQKLGR